ncbi:MAG: YkvA family protein [Pseudohongiellaceae bacterium]
MPLDITFTLSDRDLERFKTIVKRVRTELNSPQTQADIEQAAYRIVDVAVKTDLPDFIAHRLLQLKSLLDMLNDSEWGPSDAERESILKAMAYFNDPVDLIPDHIPGIGFLDDAIYIEIIVRELQVELQAYQEFCEYRRLKEEELSADGLDLKHNRSEWIAAIRDKLRGDIARARENAAEDDFVFKIL